MATRKLDLPDWLNVKAVGTVLLIKALVLTFAAQAYQIVNNQFLSDQTSFLGMWNRWDASHYLNIAQNGYTAVGEDRFLIVFFPFYPLLVAATNVVVGDSLLSGFVVTTLASLALALLFRALVKVDYSESTAQYAVFFLFVFPTSYFLHIPYTESLFLALTIGSFLAARKQMWLVCGVLGFLSCLTRINGLILVPALLFELLEDYRENRRVEAAWLYLILIPIGFVGYLLLNFYVTGDALMFMTYQREHWYRYFRFPWEGIWETVKKVNTSGATDSQMVGFQETFYIAVGLAGVVFGWAHLRWSYRVWMILNWLLFISTSFVLSVPRYTLTLFPLFILFALGAKKNLYFRAAIAVWSLLYLSLFSLQFARGSWAF